MAMKRALPPTTPFPPAQEKSPPAWTGYWLAEGAMADDTIQGVCYPFVSDDGKPLGNNVQEALHVAWAISEVPKENSETEELIKLMRLKNHVA